VKVANLQLEGLLMAVAAVNNALVRKRLLTIDDIDRALKTAEASFKGDERLFEDMSPANRDAVCFPLQQQSVRSRRAAVFRADQAGRDHQTALQRPDVKGA